MSTMEILVCAFARSGMLMISLIYYRITYALANKKQQCFEILLAKLFADIQQSGEQILYTSFAIAEL